MAWQVGKYFVKEVLLDMEVNFEIYDEDGYLCRLVPGYSGFELSKVDVSLGVEIDETVIETISNFILNKDN